MHAVQPTARTRTPSPTNPLPPPFTTRQVFACTVGQKPSKAPYYVNDPAEVQATLSKIVDVEAAAPADAASAHHVSFA